MNRRVLLASVAAGVGGLAGCLASGRNGRGADGDGGTTGDGTGDDGTSATPAVEDGVVRTVAASCAGPDVGHVVVQRTEDRVSVGGVIGAADPCHEAVLREATVEAGQLRVRVDVVRTGSLCTACTGAIDYAATIDVSNPGALDGLTVEHAGDVVHEEDWS